MTMSAIIVPVLFGLMAPAALAQGECTCDGGLQFIGDNGCQGASLTTKPCGDGEFVMCCSEPQVFFNGEGPECICGPGFEEVPSFDDCNGLRYRNSCGAGFAQDITCCQIAPFPTFGAPPCECDAGLEKVSFDDTCPPGVGEANKLCASGANARCCDSGVPAPPPPPPAAPTPPPPAPPSEEPPLPDELPPPAECVCDAPFADEVATPEQCPTAVRGKACGDQQLTLIFCCFSGL